MRIIFDMTDLYYYFEFSCTVTGIQRVQQEVFSELEPPAGAELAIVVFDRDIKFWRLIDMDWFTNLVGESRRWTKDNDAWQPRFGEIDRDFPNFPLYAPDKDDVLINVGASWSIKNYFSRIHRVREAGVKFFSFLHDVIPLTHPNYFADGHASLFSYWAYLNYMHSDLIVCNSQNTAEDFKRFLTGFDDYPLAVVPLNGDWVGGLKGEYNQIDYEDFLAENGISKNYVVSVGTIEPRKNHTTLLAVWERLIEELGEENTPDLVLVGRVGWKAEPVLDKIREINARFDKIKILENISDNRLVDLYKQSQFSVYVSKYEGWGLPVTESFLCGKAAVVADNSSLKEAGEDLAVFVNAGSESEIFEATRTLITDVKVRKNIETRIAKEFKPRSWAQIANEMCDLAINFKAKPGVDRIETMRTVSLGQRYFFWTRDMLKDFRDPKIAHRFMSGKGWHDSEPWGIWGGEKRMSLSMRLPETDGPATCYAMLNGAPGGVDVTVFINNRRRGVTHNLTEPRIIRVDMEPDTASDVTITFETDKVIDLAKQEGSGDHRKLTLGFHWFSVVSQNDVAERLNIMEEILAQQGGFSVVE